MKKKNMFNKREKKMYEKEKSPFVHQSKQVFQHCLQIYGVKSGNERVGHQRR